MECEKCNKKITDPIVLNEYGVNVHSMPTQDGRGVYFCNSCSAITGLTELRLAAALRCPAHNQKTNEGDKNGDKIKNN